MWGAQGQAFYRIFPLNLATFLFYFLLNISLAQKIELNAPKGPRKACCPPRTSTRDPLLCASLIAGLGLVSPNKRRTITLFYSVSPQQFI